MNEVITWIPVASRLPDDDETVLIALDPSEHSEPTWLGYRNEHGWYDSEGNEAHVVAWAAMPAGPQQAQEQAA